MINVNFGSMPSNQKPFPKLMKYTKSNLIILFYEPKKGMVINKSDSMWDPYEYREDWVMDVFTDYNEPITIQNA